MIAVPMDVSNPCLAQIDAKFLPPHVSEVLPIAGPRDTHVAACDVSGL